jgi:ubiquinone biosynthesis protein
VESGWVPSNTRIDELESAVRTVCEPIFNKPLKDISFAQVLLRLFETARRFDMRVQPQLILLQKTLLNIEGLGRQLYPDLDLWKTAQPVLRQWMRERASPRNLLRGLRSQLPDAVETARLLPRIIKSVVREAADGEFKVPVESVGIEQLRAEIAESIVRRDRLILAGILWLSGLIWLALGVAHPWLGWVQLLAAGWLLVFGSSAKRPR